MRGIIQLRWGGPAKVCRRRSTVGVAQRLFSSSRGVERETLSVTCGSSGVVTIDLFNSGALSTPSNPLVIYLPPAGTHLHRLHPQIPPYLFSPFAALARVNYRWNIPSSNPSAPKLLTSDASYDRHGFPTPLHDILHAYTHLTATVLPSRSLDRSLSSSPKTPYSPIAFQKPVRRPIIVYGSNLGASLATSLALTESFTSNALPTRIAGVITKNAIFNWTEISTKESLPPGLDDIINSDELALNERWNPATLHLLKKRLFSHPSSTFDSFVSPVLFFRTARMPVPTVWPGEEEMTAQTHDLDPQSETYLLPATPDPDPPISPDPLSGEGSQGKDGGSVALSSTRQAHLKFPPRNSGLKIPRSLILHSPPSIVTLDPSVKLPKAERAQKMRDEVEEICPKNQAIDMCHLMRRSMMLYEFADRAMWDSDLDPESAACERVQIAEVSEKAQEERVVREWIEDTLGSV